jgi:hypothetical protein
MTRNYFQSKNHATNGQILLQWMNVRHIFPIKKSCQTKMDRFDHNGSKGSPFFFSAIFQKLKIKSNQNLASDTKITKG